MVSTVFFACLLILFSPSSYSETLVSQTSKPNILIVYQHANKINQQLTSQLEQSPVLSGYRISHKILNTKPLETVHLNQQQLIISVGSKTTKLLLDAEITAPLLSILMPGHLAKSFQSLYSKKTNWSSLVIDQPLQRNFQLITAIMGKQRQTGVLLGPYTKNLEKQLRRAAKNSKQRIIIRHIKEPEKISQSLTALNASANVILTLPDPVIYNKNTIRGILLSTYRKKLPIIGFSKAYVKAGAIAAVYSKPEQISKQTANIANSFLKTGNFRLNTYQPSDFSVALNNRLAKSLGISLKSESAIISQIKKAERSQ